MEITIIFVKLLSILQASTEEDEVVSVPKPVYIAEILLDEKPEDFMYYVVIENFIVHECKQLYASFMAVMAFIWVFNLKYPSAEKDVFELIQKVFLDIDSSNISSRVKNAISKI